MIPVPNLWGGFDQDYFGSLSITAGGTSTLTEQDLLNSLKDSQRDLASYNALYQQEWVKPEWENHMKVSTDYTSALESTKGLTKHMLTSSFI